MRFDRYGRAETFAWTSRKLANATKRGERVANREKERYPLLADQLQKPDRFDADIEAQRRDKLTQSSERNMRDFHARVWRESRRDFQSATPVQQETIRASWLAWRGPLTSTYFRYIVDLHIGVVERRAAAHRARELQIRVETRRIINQQTRLELEAA